MSGRSRRAPPAYRRYEIGLSLLHAHGFEIAAPGRLPHGFLAYAPATIAEWHLRGLFPWPSGAYIELAEHLDTAESYPQPWGGYEYFVHVELPGGGRNVSFHKDRTKPADLLYHWHDYPDGQRRSEPVPMGPVSLRWFLAVAWLLAEDPSRSVPELLRALPPPGPADPA